MKSRAVPFFAVLITLCALASATGAQVVPGLPRPGGRAREQVRPPPRDTTPRGQRPGAQRGSAGRDTTPAVQDTLIDRLLQLEGYVPVEYQADSAEYRASDRTLRLRGDSRVQREGNTIVAEDSIVYREQAELIAAFGNPRGDPTEGEEITGDVFYYDLAARRASVRGARTKITESATWYVAGNVTDERGQRIFAENSTFTSDDREVPAYHFKADKIMIIRNRILVGRPAYLYFRNVPVMALPFIFQDLERGRRSGILIPRFEINDIIRTRGGGRNSRGTGREISNIGYYFALNQYLGLELAARWRSETYTAIRGDLDFNFRRRFLTGELAFERFWQTDGPSRLTLNGATNWEYNERTRMALALAYASSSEFERNRTVENPYQQVADLSSNFSGSRRFDWGTLQLSAERRQSIANGDVTFRPSFNLNVEPIELFAGSVLNVSLQGSRSTNTPGDALARRLQPTEQAGLSTGVAVTLGGLTVSTTAAYDKNASESLAEVGPGVIEPGVDTTRSRFLPGISSERVNFSASTSYQIPLWASTRISPSISFSREVVRRDSTFREDEALPDSLRGVFGEFVQGRPRISIGASLATDLYGFFPGFGDYSAIRHHVKPILTWRYSPAVEERDTARARIQERVFGRFVGRTENLLTIGFDQTFEAKVREDRQPEPVRPLPGDSAAAAADTAGGGAAGLTGAAGLGNAAQPTEPRKVTLLAVNTSILTYSFEDLDTLGTRFQNEEISNTVRTDLLGGLQFTMTHDLFTDRFEDLESGGRRVRRGGFSPFLTSFNTSFSLGQSSALFRWLGFARTSEQERQTERGQTPDTAGARPPTPQGGTNFTNNNQQAGGGPWNLSVNYSLSRNRRGVRDTIPGTFDRGNSQVGGTLTFSPTKNWGVSWNTQYSLTDGTFSVHSINLKRDLYRWQANFDYILAPNGNTSFSFTVHLIDLPDLKADYNERSLGVDRPENGQGNNFGPTLQRGRVLPPPPPPPAPDSSAAPRDTTPQR